LAAAVERWIREGLPGADGFAHHHIATGGNRERAARPHGGASHSGLGALGEWSEIAKGATGMVDYLVRWTDVWQGWVNATIGRDQNHPSRALSNQIENARLSEKLNELEKPGGFYSYVDGYLWRARELKERKEDKLLQQELDDYFNKLTFTDGLLRPYKVTANEALVALNRIGHAGYNYTTLSGKEIKSLTPLLRQVEYISKALHKDLKAYGSQTDAKATLLALKDNPPSPLSAWILAQG
jgi:hypothetical protein